MYNLLNSCLPCAPCCASICCTSCVDNEELLVLGTRLLYSDEIDRRVGGLALLHKLAKNGDGVAAHCLGNLFSKPDEPAKFFHYYHRIDAVFFRAKGDLGLRYLDMAKSRNVKGAEKDYNSRQGTLAYRDKQNAQLKEQFKREKKAEEEAAELAAIKRKEALEANPVLKELDKQNRLLAEGNKLREQQLLQLGQIRDELASY